MYLRQKVTAHPAIGLVSDYIRENFRTATRKEKLDVRKKVSEKNFPAIQVPEHNPSLSWSRAKSRAKNRMEVPKQVMRLSLRTPTKKGGVF